MIKPEEIRIGNIFQQGIVDSVDRTTCVLQSPESTQNHYVPVFVEIKDLIPIIITSVQLIEFGFEYEDLGGLCSPYYFKENCPFSIEYMDFQPIIDSDEICNYNMEFVHQLQNIYFDLTNQELTMPVKT